jgi:hypothetical protein
MADDKHQNPQDSETCGSAVKGMWHASDPRRADGEGEQTLTTRQGHPGV